MRDAPRAGSRPATAALTATRHTAPPRVHGSFGETPKSWLATKRDAHRAAAVPIAAPIVTIVRIRRIKNQMTCRRCAPSAIRSPISCVRRAAAYATSPKMPMAARRRATSPKKPESPARSLSRDNSCSRLSVTGLISEMSRFLSTDAISRRTVAASAEGSPAVRITSVLPSAAGK